jgi:2-desacetyl-2-hydroxyethyl bacteriochlorophyllide A dehydrogenase
MRETMRAVVFEAPSEAVVREVPYPVPGPGQVTIEVRACGLCGTDRHLFRGEFPTQYPLIPGHELAGVIAEVGPESRSWRVGAPVIADPNIARGECYFCCNGQVNHCLNHQAIGVTMDGAFAEFVAVPARNVYAIEGDLSFDEAAMVEPLSCVVYGLRRLRLQAGDQVLIFGAGPIGLLLMQGCKYGGASSVTIVDLDEKRLEMARSLGATHTVLADDQQEATLREIAHYGYDAVIDATGVPSVVERCLDYVKSGGKLLLFGVCPQEAKVTISPFEVYRRDLEIIGTFALRYTFDAALALLQNRVIQVKPLIRPVISLDEVPGVLTNHEQAMDALKVMIKPWNP